MTYAAKERSAQRSPVTGKARARRSGVAVLSITLLLAQSVAASGPHRAPARAILPARATGFPFESRAKAIAGHRTKSDRFLLMNGIWRVSCAPDAASSPAGFARSGYDSTGWEEVAVPVGWGATSDASAVRTIGASSAVASYRRDIDVPTGWSGAQIILHLGAVASPYQLWINDKKIGGGDATRLPAEFDVTSFVHPGRNVVGIQTFDLSKAGLPFRPGCRQRSDMEREIFLMAVPRTHIRDFFVHAGLLDDGRTGGLAVDVKVTPGKATIARYVLMDGVHTVLRGHASVVAGSAERRVRLRGRLTGVKPWTAETPDLYFLLVELYDVEGHIIQSTYARIGFRTISFDGTTMMVNGRPIRQQMADYPKTIAAHPSHDDMEQSLQRLKAAGIDVIRTTNGPEESYLYDLADRYGLYVMHVGHADAVEIERDKNHPSIIPFPALPDQRGTTPR